MNCCIPQPGDNHPYYGIGTFTTVSASTSRATVSGLTVTMTYAVEPPTRTVRRRYTLTPVTRWWEWAAIVLAVLIAIAWLIQ